MRFLSKRYDKTSGYRYSIYKSDNCHTCPHQGSCTKQKKGIRYLKIYPHPELRDEMIAKMSTKKAKRTYRRRKETVEPAIGCIKYDLGLNEFLTRSLGTVRTEFRLTCTALNIKKMWLRTRERVTGSVGSTLAPVHLC